MICRIKQKSFQFLFEKLVSVISLLSTGRLFHALGAATENARSDETSLERGTTRSCLPAERREARPGMLATGVTNSVSVNIVQIGSNPYCIDFQTHSVGDGIKGARSRHLFQMNVCNAARFVFNSIQENNL